MSIFPRWNGHDYRGRTVSSSHWKTFRLSIWVKCPSLLKRGISFSIQAAAIQRSFSGIGVPFRFRINRTSAYLAATSMVMGNRIAYPENFCTASSFSFLFTLFIAPYSSSPRTGTGRKRIFCVIDNPADLRYSLAVGYDGVGINSQVTRILQWFQTPKR